MSTEIKGLGSLAKELKKYAKKVKKYDGIHEITLPYSKESWENMTKNEQDKAIEKAKNKYIEQIKKDLFK